MRRGDEAARSGAEGVGASRRRWVGLLGAALVLVSACSSATSDTKTSTPTATAPAPTATTNPALSQDWPVYGFDPAHSLNNPHETILTKATVGRLHRIWRVKLPDVADSSPILAHGMKMPDGGVHDVLYVTTKAGRLLAVDAANGKTLWSKQQTGPHYTTSSPVIDDARQYVFAYGLEGSLHKYNATTGDEVTGNGWPVRVTYMPESEKVSSPLNYLNGHVYITTTGYPGDRPPYQGHLVMVDADTGATSVFNSLCSNVKHVLQQGECSSNQSGIWGRSGAVIDPLNGDIYLTTGNGDFNGKTNWGDTVIQLSPDASHIVDSYTPANQSELDATDADLGSTSALLLPQIAGSKTPYLLLQGGKDSRLLVVNRQNMSGKGGPGHLGGETQVVQPTCGVYNEPTTWTNPSTKQLWVFLAGRCAEYGYRVVTDGSGKTRLVPVWQNTRRTYGTSPVIAGNVLYVGSDRDLAALDPTTGKQLWTSAQQSAGGTIGTLHWQGLIVVDGRIYAPDNTGYLSAYGL